MKGKNENVKWDKKMEETRAGGKEKTMEWKVNEREGNRDEGKERQCTTGNETGRRREKRYR